MVKLQSSKMNMLILTRILIRLSHNRITTLTWLEKCKWNLSLFCIFLSATQMNAATFQSWRQERFSNIRMSHSSLKETHSVTLDFCPQDLHTFLMTIATVSLYSQRCTHFTYNHPHITYYSPCLYWWSCDMKRVMSSLSPFLAVSYQDEAILVIESKIVSNLVSAASH